MDDLKRFRDRIFIHCGIVAAAAELISVPFIGWALRFLLGMVVGTTVTIVNFIILIAFARRMLQLESKGQVVGGYFIRMLVYGVAFYLCLKIGKYCAIAAAIGFFTLHISSVIIYGIETNLPGAPKNPLNSWTEPKKWRDPSEWEDDDDFSDF